MTPKEFLQKYYESGYYLFSISYDTIGYKCYITLLRENSNYGFRLVFYWNAAPEDITFLKCDEYDLNRVKFMRDGGIAWMDNDCHYNDTFEWVFIKEESNKAYQEFKQHCKRLTRKFYK